MILAKNAKFFYLDLVKITLQIMLNYFEEKKETFFHYKKENFSKSKKPLFFFKGVNPCFWRKNAIFSLFPLAQNKTTNNAKCLCEEKKNLF